MNITVKFIGLPDLQKLIGGQEIQIEIKGDSFGALLEQLVETYGKPIKEILLAEKKKNQVSLLIQVLRNEEHWIERVDSDCLLREGDTITFMMMVAGG